jgi:magnesium chelatase family protein
VRTVIGNARFAFLADRVTLNLAPGRRGYAKWASFDLPIALGSLATTGSLQAGGFGHFFVGELALDGSCRCAVGLTCRRRGLGTLLVPHDNRSEVAAVDGLRVLPVSTLREAVALLNGQAAPIHTALKRRHGYRVALRSTKNSRTPRR